MILGYCDASFNPTTRKGGFGIYIKYPKGTFKMSQHLPNTIECVGEAEAYAVQKTVDIIHVLRYPNLSYIGVYTDRQDFAVALSNNKQYTSFIGIYKTTINQLIKPYNHIVQFNYIPRNSTTEHKWCDTQAKKYLYD